MAQKRVKQVGTFEDRFLKCLERLSDRKDVAVSNSKLMEELGWQEDRYEKTRDILIARKIIKTSLGRGGPIKFVKLPEKLVKEREPLKVFISYSHKDEEITQFLLDHLFPLERLKMIKIWCDRQIKPGDEWGGEISSSLESANIIILIVSVDFIKSTYCYDVELERAIERHNNKEARVIPVIARQCVWRHSPFRDLLALPKDGKAISTLNRDDALTAVAEAIFKIADEMLKPEKPQAN